MQGKREKKKGGNNAREKYRKRLELISSKTNYTFLPKEIELKECI